jgi:ubiquitin carboxyl-terminal hydrolase 4/11/15
VLIQLISLDATVSKQKDPTRVVSQSAYLLFYRRRSDRPLGGPKFQEIIKKFDDLHERPEDDTAESGEERGLVGNSSLRGSSSALTGVEAAHHRANPGLDRTVDPQEIEGLPAYKAHQSNDEDAAPLSLRDAQMNDGLPLESIEDEGIDMGMNYNNLGRLHSSKTSVGNWNITTGSPKSLAGHWNFSGLEGLNQEQNFVSGTGSEIDRNGNSDNEFDPDGSDIVQHNSSASSGSIRGRLADFENAIPEGDDDGVFNDPSPVPDIEDDNQIDTLTLHRELYQARRDAAMMRPDFEVPAAHEAEEVEEPATEIHVEEDEGLKMD